MSQSESLGEISRWTATTLLNERRGRTVSGVVTDAVADYWEGLTGRQPDKDTVMGWVHLSMLFAAALAGSRILRD